MLIDLAYCANCGARLWYFASERRYYRCSCRSSGGYCTARWCAADLAETQVLHAVGMLQLPAEWREQALQQAEQLLATEEKDVSRIDQTTWSTSSNAWYACTRTG